MIMEGYENCVGCLLRTSQKYEDGQIYEACKLNPVNKNNEACPCSLCLIKTMCKHGCDEYKLFRDAKFREGIKKWPQRKKIL